MIEVLRQCELPLCALWLWFSANCTSKHYPHASTRTGSADRHKVVDQLRKSYFLSSTAASFVANNRNRFFGAKLEIVQRVATKSTVIRGVRPHGWLQNSEVLRPAIGFWWQNSSSVETQGSRRSPRRATRAQSSAIPGWMTADNGRLFGFPKNAVQTQPLRRCLTRGWRKMASTPHGGIGLDARRAFARTRS